MDALEIWFVSTNVRNFYIFPTMTEMTTFQKTFPIHCTSSEFTTLIRPDFSSSRMTALPWGSIQLKFLRDNVPSRFVI
ncbi:ADM_collapsed_G0035430.mRNA.1.CDS.1 [Saccharomyces cerevisiae]|nr:ADM_collapsed_G0035430.mRNA.1.CDS.1 [Saccharomyces cerevisiae]